MALFFRSNARFSAYVAFFRLIPLGPDVGAETVNEIWLLLHFFYFFWGHVSVILLDTKKKK